LREKEDAPEGSLEEDSFYAKSATRTARLTPVNRKRSQGTKRRVDESASFSDQSSSDVSDPSENGSDISEFEEKSNKKARKK
jgi:hypothetical protein